MIRRHGSRPTIALWMLVALADVALVVAAAGALAVLLVVAGAMVLAGAAAGYLLLQRRAVPQRESVLRRRA
ncbi:hypothetical protein GCM10020358_75310 [Amorphoplanes nipponensis]|uniref:Uncharacterized protein n=1 Tax=Actinoplanes nipponensis TaxID=135950 RepID=A0A919MM19_9ACTN|nr:hypothetical protein [Actinoplanes nipponensis]GIE50106.1 hypothetical protein Ani05nite_36400 [Actinoplanes nipponensis]